MKRYEGMHFYINITNLNNIVADEELRTGRVNHSIHELDTFFTQIENFGKKNFDNFHVEKVTGSRLHMYVLDDLEEAFIAVSEVSRFANKLAASLNKEVAKYKTLINFSIQVGACYGKFYDFEFKNDYIDEETSIGYACNYAAKLQGLAKPAYIAISSDIYESLDSEYQDKFVVQRESKVKKYGQTYYAYTLISNLKTDIDFTPFLDSAGEYANNVNLGDISFSSAQQPINFSNLSKTNCKKVEGIPFFADVRGFTAQFEDDDSNLEEMSDKTRNILSCMYKTVRKHHGVHVQFQGDREMALFHDYTDYNCIDDAVETGLRLIDDIQEFDVNIGIGEAAGTLFATKIGARGEKDNILIGTTVTTADKYEDELAGKNQLVVSHDIYDYLKVNNSFLASKFEKINDSCYKITVGYNELLFEKSLEEQKKNTQRSNYNGAWGE